MAQPGEGRRRSHRADLGARGAPRSATPQAPSTAARGLPTCADSKPQRGPFVRWPLRVSN
eukprot:7218190-Alexandrium_andersonii.AAC.1